MNEPQAQTTDHQESTTLIFADLMERLSTIGPNANAYSDPAAILDERLLEVIA